MFSAPSSDAEILRRAAMAERVLEKKLQALEEDYKNTINAERTKENREEQTKQQNNEQEEAWTKFNELTEEEEENTEESQNPLEEEEETTPPVPTIPQPLSSTHLAAIHRAMSGISVPPPPWAFGMAEKEWAEKIIPKIQGKILQQEKTGENTDKIHTSRRKQINKKKKTKNKTTISSSSEATMISELSLVEITDFPTEFPPVDE